MPFKNLEMNEGEKKILIEYTSTEVYFHLVIKRGGRLLENIGGTGAIKNSMLAGEFSSSSLTEINSHQENQVW